MSEKYADQRARNVTWMTAAERDAAQTDAARKNTLHVRYHLSIDMRGLGEMREVTAPAAVVLRKDGSVDVYGNVAVVDQLHRDAPG
jgi:hypothetical protein